MIYQIFLLSFVAAYYVLGAPTSVAPAQQPTVIPIVSQSEELEPNGTYKFSYETGNGIKREETSYDKVVPKAAGRKASSEEGGESNESGDSDEIHVQRGSYSYTAPDGTVITLSYIADENGFQPIGSHLPRAPTAVPISPNSSEKSGRALKTPDNSESGSAQSPSITSPDSVPAIAEGTNDENKSSESVPTKSAEIATVSSQPQGNSEKSATTDSSFNKPEEKPSVTDTVMSASPQSPSPQSTSPQSASPQSESPQSTSPQTTSPQLSSPQSLSPQSASPQPARPQSASPQTDDQPEAVTTSVPNESEKTQTTETSIASQSEAQSDTTEAAATTAQVTEAGSGAAPETEQSDSQTEEKSSESTTPAVSNEQTTDSLDSIQTTLAASDEKTTEQSSEGTTPVIAATDDSSTTEAESSVVTDEVTTNAVDETTPLDSEITTKAAADVAQETTELSASTAAPSIEEVSTSASSA